MTNRLRNDIKTIIELLAFLIINVCFSFIYSQYSWIVILLSIIWIVKVVYDRYYKSKSPDIILFPTLNDEYSKMTYITFAIMIFIFSIIGYFAFGLNPYYSIIGAVTSIAVFLFGFFESPRGWILIKNNTIRLYGIEESIDTRQLKEIILINERITLTNIYGEVKKSTLLKLDPVISVNIKKFLEDRLQKNGILITDNVTE